MKRLFEQFIQRLYVEMSSYLSRKMLRRYIRSSSPKLTTIERAQIQNIWGKLPLKISDKFHRICKGEKGFDVGYLPEDIYNPIIRGALNPALQSYVFENKALYDILFKDIKQPQIILKNLYGQFFNANSNAINADQARQILINFSEFIIKPCLYSDSGMNVSLFKNPMDNEYVRRVNNIDNLLTRYKKNFVISAKLSQHPLTARFNPESVNTIRVTSLFLNGRVTLHSPIFRCGNKGSIVDNTGAGGIAIGLNTNGILSDFGYDIKMNKHYETSVGIKFSGMKIPAYTKLNEIIVRQHCQMPTVHLIGWDFAIDEYCEPVMLEINTSYPGIIFEQLCSGPIFGDRYEEVINFVLQNYPCLKIAL